MTTAVTWRRLGSDVGGIALAVVLDDVIGRDVTAGRRESFVMTWYNVLCMVNVIRACCSEGVADGVRPTTVFICIRYSRSAGWLWIKRARRTPAVYRRRRRRRSFRSHHLRYESDVVDVVVGPRRRRIAEAAEVGSGCGRWLDAGRRYDAVWRKPAPMTGKS